VCVYILTSIFNYFIFVVKQCWLNWCVLFVKNNQRIFEWDLHVETAVDVLVEQLKYHFTNCTKWYSQKMITDSCLSLPSYSRDKLIINLCKNKQ